MREVTELLGQLCADVPAIRVALAGVRLDPADLLGFEGALLGEGETSAEGRADARAYGAAWLASAVLHDHRGNREDLTVALARALAALGETWPAGKTEMLATMREKLSR